MMRCHAPMCLRAFARVLLPQAGAKGGLPSPLCIYVFHERFFGDMVSNTTRESVAFTTVLRTPRERVASQYRNQEALRDVVRSQELEALLKAREDEQRKQRVMRARARENDGGEGIGDRDEGDEQDVRVSIDLAALMEAGLAPSLEACVRAGNATCAGNRQAWYLLGQTYVRRAAHAVFSACVRAQPRP